MISLNANAYLRLLQIIFPGKVDWLYLYTVSGHEVYLSHVLIMSAVILIFALINSRGVKTGFYLQNFVSALLVFFVFGLVIVIGQRSDLAAFDAQYIAPAVISFKDQPETES